MFRNILRKILSLFETPIHFNRDLDEWAKMEFGREVHSSDLEGKVA